MSKLLLENKLMEKLTNWPIWFAAFALVVFLLPSFLISLLNIFFSNSKILTQISPIIQFSLIAILPILFIRAYQRKKPSKSDLWLDNDLNWSSIKIIVIVFIITHICFYLLWKISWAPSNAVTLFKEYGFDKSSWAAIIAIITSVVFAPICEEIFYRGIIFRSLHDGSTRFFKKSKSIFTWPIIISITLTAVAFILPHVQDFKFEVYNIAYFVSSAGFSLVYILTWSLMAAMVSHSLQSCLAFSQILIFWHGDFVVSPFVYIIVFLCPLIVYLLAKLIRRVY